MHVDGCKTFRHCVKKKEKFMKKEKLFLCLALITATLKFGYSQNVSEVKIGNQIWMSKNLTVTKFRNGDPIPEAKTPEEWKNADLFLEPAWCYYNNDPANAAKYGKLYNFNAISDPRGLAPEGWHLPSDSEWTEVSDFLGGAAVAGNKMKNKTGWNENGNGSNESGFSGLPGGLRYGGGDFRDIGISGFWWSSTSTTPYRADYRQLYSSGSDIYSFDHDKASGFSVRCIKD